MGFSRFWLIMANQDHTRRIITFVSLLHILLKETSARERDIIVLNNGGQKIKIHRRVIRMIFPMIQRAENDRAILGALPIYDNELSTITVADPKGVRWRGGQMNPFLNLNYFIIVMNFRKNWSNCSNRTPLG